MSGTTRSVRQRREVFNIAEQLRVVSRFALLADVRTAHACAPRVRPKSYTDCRESRRSSGALIGLTSTEPAMAVSQGVRRGSILALLALSAARSMATAQD